MILGAIILAAGESSRNSGGNKLLMPLEGVPIIKRVYQTAQSVKFEPIVIVTGFETEDIRAALAGSGANVKYNRNWESGMASSLSLGAHNLPDSIGGFAVILGDMPLITQPILATLLAHFMALKCDHIVYPVYEGKQGHPVFFPTRFLKEIRDLKGDAGAKTLLKKHADQCHELDLETDAVVIDCDTADDYLAIVERISNG